MGPWTSLLVAYLLGGVTFIPLVIVAVLAHAAYTLPYRHDAAPQTSNVGNEDGIVDPEDDTTALEKVRNDYANAAGGEKDVKTKPNHDIDVAAGYFAVCREYTPMGINAKPIERTTPVGSTTVAAPSPSVYQTMYRSIFDRKPVTGPLENRNNTMTSGRPKKAGNVFYVVLRHGHLMLFDDDEQLEVRHVISLAHHDVSICSGGDVTPEGELFIKRNALCLSRRIDAGDLAPDSQLSKPFYLFSENCSAKEDFYFALLRNQEQLAGDESSPDGVVPRPLGFQVKNIIALVQRLHSSTSEEHVHTRWFNALIGRVFLAISQTFDLEHFIKSKITKKIARVKRPSFLTNITIQKIYTGDAAPYFTNMKLKDLTVEGECVIEADVKYTGNFRLEVAATAKIDLGTRFKAREVNLVLAVVLKKVEGHIMFKIKPPPSNRIWTSFVTMPKMDMDIEPIVSSRQITYTVILRQIENRIKEVVAETLVHPFWDDTPFFKTEHKHWRGGIFEGDDALEPSANDEDEAAQEGRVETVDRLEDGGTGAVNGNNSAEVPKIIEKSHSLPHIDAAPDKTGLLGRKAGKSGLTASATGSSTSVDTDNGGAAIGSRSPKIVKDTLLPTVGTDSSNADLYKPSSSPPDHATNFMAALASKASRDSIGPAYPSITRASTYSSSSSSKDGKKDELDDDAGGDSVQAGVHRRNTASSADTTPIDASTDGPRSPSTSSFKSQTASLGRTLFRRDGSTPSVTSVPATGDGSTGAKRNNSLAAVTQAAAQARQWGWNAIQRQREGKKNQGEVNNHVDLTQPMGRGHPLPPPGTPLPGPNGKVMPPAGVPKRKPVGEALGSSTAADAEQDDHPRRLSLIGGSGSQDPVSAQKPITQPDRPALPQRRRRGGSRDEEQEEEEHSMLVVAAPEDESLPASPVDEREEYISRTAGLSNSPPGKAAVVERKPLQTTSINEALLAAQIATEARTDPAHKPSVVAHATKDSKPGNDDDDSAPAQAEDDTEDDISGWLEKEEEPGDSTAPAS